MILPEIELIFREHGFYQGRMISGSKSGYRHRFPENDVVFNACIFTKNCGKWHGDLDITRDKEMLQKLCDILGEEMLITFESVGWKAETVSYDEIEKLAHAKFMPKSEVYLSKIYDGMDSLNVGNMIIITSKGVDWKQINVK